MIIPSPIKMYGGKSRLKKWLFSNFPHSYNHFIDLCGGGGSVVLNTKANGTLSWNDIDPKLYTMMYYIKYYYEEFFDIIKNIECTEENFIKWKDVYNRSQFKNRSLQEAISVYITRNMSRGGIGKDFSRSSRLRGGRPEHINAWENNKKELSVISNRLQNISIYNMYSYDFLTMIKNYLNPQNTLVYADFPYVQSTRTSPDIYDHEMTVEDHIEMAKLFNDNDYLVAISGYDSELYQCLYKPPKWRMISKEVKNNAGQNKIKQKRVECLWMNY